MSPEIHPWLRFSSLKAAVCSRTVPTSTYILPRIWVRPLPPRAASRLSGLVRRLGCSSLNSVLAMCQADFGQGLGPHAKMSIQPITDHQSPITRTPKQTNKTSQSFCRTAPPATCFCPLPLLLGLIACMGKFHDMFVH